MSRALHAPEPVTEAIDRVVGEVGGESDEFAAAAARRIPGAQPVVISRDVWWADLPEPTGSGPGFRRPVVVVQGDALNRSRIATVVCVPLTSNLKWADAPGERASWAASHWPTDGAW